MHQPLVGAIGIETLQEGGRKHAPSGESVDIEWAALHQFHPGRAPIVWHFQSIRHHQTQGEGQGFGRTYILIDSVHQHIRAVFPGLDGDGIGSEAVVKGLDGGAARIYDFHSEGPVIAAGNSGYYRHADVLDILLNGIDLCGVGEHYILGIIVGSVVLLAG